ncbi:hypothetical protein HAX54_025922 [Datura stramonium]|uniref:Uncharacterized protein n=1 Tax=Datura stramonium TaxID=4076 RepID=A0ABS8V2E0_DATST|nr:hypothetical protein [Datura stramonium]
MLRDAVFEAEDTLDELATEALRCKLEPDSQIFSQQVRNWNFIAMRSRIEELITRLEYIAKQKDVLGLETNKKSCYGKMCRGPSTPLILESHVYGRKFEMLSDVKRLRTFLPLAPSQGAEFCYLTKKVLSDILPKLSCLRVLSLSYYCITEIPESIGCLKHLRFINFSYTEIKYLPQSISNLYNLQTLLPLHNCDYLIELPADMGKLLNLRYLDVSGSGIQKIPLGLDKLVCLRILPEFVVGSNVSSIRTLPEFTVGTNISGTSMIKK